MVVLEYENNSAGAVPMTEDHARQPANSYGWTKFFMERNLESCDRAHGLRFVAPSGRPPRVEVYGHDYATSDGTALRSSALEVIRVTGKPIPVEYRARIIRTAWQWQSNHPQGYRAA